MELNYPLIFATMLLTASVMLLLLVCGVELTPPISLGISIVSPIFIILLMVGISKEGKH